MAYRLTSYKPFRLTEKGTILDNRLHYSYIPATRSSKGTFRVRPRRWSECGSRARSRKPRPGGSGPPPDRHYDRSPRSAVDWGLATKGNTRCSLVPGSAVLELSQWWMRPPWRAPRWSAERRARPKRRRVATLTCVARAASVDAASEMELRCRRRMIVESDAPPTILRSLRELRLVPPPRCRGAGWFAP